MPEENRGSVSRDTSESLDVPRSAIQPAFRDGLASEGISWVSFTSSKVLYSWQDGHFPIQPEVS